MVKNKRDSTNTGQLKSRPSDTLFNHHVKWKSAHKLYKYVDIYLYKLYMSAYYRIISLNWIESD